MSTVRRWALDLSDLPPPRDLYLFSDVESRRLCSRVLPYDTLRGQAPVTPRLCNELQN